MVDVTMDLDEVTSRAYAKGLPAHTWVKLVGKWLDGRDLKDQIREKKIISSLFAFLPDLPALILKYLSTAIQLGLISSRAVFVHLLFRTKSSHIPAPALSTICRILLAHPASFETGDSIPSSLVSPLPQSDVGPSSPPPTQREWALSLLIPLLKICTSPSTRVQPVTQLLGRILGIVAPYPAPPFEVGLEVSQLMGTLPDILATPLKESLSGLMINLALSDGAAQTQAPANTTQPQQATTNTKPLEPVGNTPNTSDITSQSPLESFAGIRTQAVTLLWTNYIQTRSRERLPVTSSAVQIPTINPGLIKLLKLCWQIFDNGEALLTTLINTLFGVVIDQTPVLEGRYVDYLITLAEDLPTMLRWWKDQSDCKLQYPSNLPQVLKATFKANEAGLSRHNHWRLEQSFELKAIENEEGTRFTLPQGWAATSLHAELCSHLAVLELINQDGLEVAILKCHLRPPWVDSGESLMQCVASGSKAHLPALSLHVISCPGAARSLSEEVIKMIQAYPAIQPPESLLVNLSSSPALISAITSKITPSALFALAVEHMVETSEDPNIISEDPQGSMTRFGEGLLFVETLAAQYQLPVPALLQDARRALSWHELNTAERGMVNGWITALFGSDGIDDETLLSTTPQNFCRLCCGLFQQAISATASGQIDLDTLHSGLSYFSQPLLNWSLGGIVTWLCREITRQGLLSAIHLDVLQNLLVSSALPDGLLRAVGPHIAGLLVPNSGLEPVFKSAAFNPDTIASKLGAVGVSIPDQATSSNTLVSFVGELQTARRLDVRPGWYSTLLSSLDSGCRAEGNIMVIDILIAEVLAPNPAEVVQGASDHLGLVSSLLLILDRSGHSGSPSLVETIVRHHLPLLMDGHGSAFILNNPQALVRALRQSLILLDAIQPESTARLVSELVEEIKHQRTRPIRDARETTGNGPVKRVATSHKCARTIGGPEKRLLDMLVKDLLDDPESKLRWPPAINTL